MHACFMCVYMYIRICTCIYVYTCVHTHILVYLLELCIKTLFCFPLGQKGLPGLQGIKGDQGDQGFPGTKGGRIYYTGGCLMDDLGK